MVSRTESLEQELDRLQIELFGEVVQPSKSGGTVDTLEDLKDKTELAKEIEYFFIGEEDATLKEKVEATSGFENLHFTMRNTLQEPKLKDTFEGGDKNKIDAAIQDTLEWLNKNQLAEKDEFEMKQNKLTPSSFSSRPTRK